MAKSSSQSSGEILHFNAVRLRVTGSGNLKQSLKSLDDVHGVDLTPVVMQSATNRELVTLANFIDQRGYLELKTTGFQEIFNISKIVIYVRPIASGYPQ